MEDGEFAIRDDGASYLKKGTKTFADGTVHDGEFALQDDGETYLKKG